MEVYAIANQKGGVTKTTSTVSLAAALARLGKRVLMVDLDPQASLTEYFIRPSDLRETVYSLVMTGKRLSPVVLAEQVHLLATNIELAAAEIQLSTKMGFETSLRRGIRQYEKNYDFCLLDCPPTLGVLSRIALVAADRVLIPVACELLAARTLELILDHVSEVRGSELNNNLYPWYILPTLYNSREKEDIDTLESIRNIYGELVYPTPVPRKTDYKKAARQQVDIYDIDPSLAEIWDELAEKMVQDAKKGAM